MSFTYTPSSPNDVTRCRYHIGDTIEASAMYSDEEITFVISEEGTYQKAVISLIRSAIARLAHEPDMEADWLDIEWRTSSENWARLLSEKQKAFNLGMRIVGVGKTVYRQDSYQTSEPTYNYSRLDDPLW